MFNNILVGIDDHDGGRDALALAHNLLANGKELTLAYVYHGDVQLGRGSNAAYPVAEREHAAAVLERASKQASVQAHLRWRGAPSVGQGLHELAEVIEADLLVVGSSRHGTFGRVFLGDDTHAALNGAPCAVAVAPTGYAKHPSLMREIGVAYNGSSESDRAVTVARLLAARHGAKLSAFEAVWIPWYGFGTDHAAPNGAIDELVDHARERIAALGEIEPHAVFGEPAKELALYSASLDLLVVGSRSEGPIGRLVHGSTSQQLARAARCPLLLLTCADAKALTEESNEEGLAAITA